jgi:hypothetical protein
MAVLLTYLPPLFLFFDMFLPSYQEEHLHYRSKFKRLCIFIGSMNRLLSYIRSMMSLALELLSSPFYSSSIRTLFTERDTIDEELKGLRM